MGTPCDLKQKFDTKEEANLERISYMKRVVLLLSPMGVYKCEEHKCYHIGHSKTDDQRRAFWQVMNWWRKHV